MFEIRPSRSKGQNFLINEKVYDDIIKAAGVDERDSVLEVGPGLGFMTAKLSRKVRRVVAVELDDRLAAYLQMAVDSRAFSNVQVVNRDILTFNVGDHFLPSEPFKIVANLPYNITSIFLRSFLSAARQPESMTLMLQKEVAERIVASPPNMSVLAVSVQYYADAEIIREVKAGNFWPEPEVDSAIIRLKIKNKAENSAQHAAHPFDDRMFFRLVRSGFSSKRKMLKNNLAAGLRIEVRAVESVMAEQGLDPKIRAEELSLENWQNLVAALAPLVV